MGAIKECKEKNAKVFLSEANIKLINNFIVPFLDLGLNDINTNY